MAFNTFKNTGNLQYLSVSGTSLTNNQAVKGSLSMGHNCADKNNK